MRQSTKPILISGAFSGGKTLQALADTGMFFIDHRGLPSVFPEETMEAFRDSLADGAQFVEFDVQRLSDGQLVVMHDSTVDRTTTSTGDVTAFDSAGWQALVVDAGSFLGGGWGNYNAPFLFQAFDAFCHRNALLAIEVKASDAGLPMLEMMQRWNVSKKHALVNSFTAADLTPFILDGWTTCLNLGTYTGSPTPASLLATGYKWIAVAAGTTNENCDTLRAVGLKVIVYTLNTKYQTDPYAGHADAIYSDDAVYLRGSAKRLTDPFSLQRWYHGQQAVNASGDGGGRGAFYTPNLWGYNLSGANTWAGALQGWASPIGGGSTLPSVTIDFSVKFESAFATDRFAWLSLMTTDQPLASDIIPPAAPAGYVFICRKSGSVEIWEKVAGSTASIASIAVTAGTTISDGATATYRITVTPTDLTLRRLDVETLATVSDSSARGAFLAAGVKGSFAKFSNVSVSV